MKVLFRGVPSDSEPYDYLTTLFKENFFTYTTERLKQYRSKAAHYSYGVLSGFRVLAIHNC